MEILIETYLSLIFIIFFYMLIWFLFSTIRQRNDVADIAWGIGFVLVSYFSFFKNGLSFDRELLVTILVTVWAIRLSTHIYLRNRNKSEDYRYMAWRKEWGKWFYLRSFLQVFLLQGMLLLVVVSPVIITNIYRGNNLSLIDLIGFVVWVIGFFFEAIGDYQLSEFIKIKKKGQILQSGLWQYSRHPNYFGEVAQWWGIGIIALSVPYGYLGLIGPLTITYLITQVSGIPLLEKKYKDNPDFEVYKKKTSIFFPLPPKK